MSMTRDERCACGAVITVALPVVDAGEIVRAVRQHQATARHLNWRARGGYDSLPVMRDAYEGQLK
jgi:hypothetical protein